jgi:TonB family protein
MLKRNGILFLLIFASTLLFGEIKVSEADAKKAAIEKPAPTLGTVARQLKLSGRVEIVVSIDEEGNVTDVRLDKGSPVLGAGALTAVKKWKFEPFKSDDGKPSKASTTLVFEFKQ